MGFWDFVFWIQGFEKEKKKLWGRNRAWLEGKLGMWSFRLVDIRNIDGGGGRLFAGGVRKGEGRLGRLGGICSPSRRIYSRCSKLRAPTNVAASACNIARAVGYAYGFL